MADDPKIDLSFLGASASNDQALTAASTMAKLCGKFLTELVANGFTRAEALELLGKWLVQITANGAQGKK